VSIGRLSGVGALWDCVPRVCGGGGGCAGGGVPLGAVPVLSWCGVVSLGGKHTMVYSQPTTQLSQLLTGLTLGGEPEIDTRNTVPQRANPTQAAYAHPQKDGLTLNLNPQVG